ncbi:MAG: ABC transporter ATP-binding protein, partial [Synergistota bacterium]|nr:ABC transporter ATP-binding protein [Synergistota bacterium]
MSARLEASVSRKLGSFNLDATISMQREIGVLFGPSGSGKSQTLRLLCGLARPDSGEVRLKDRVLVKKPGGVFIPAARRRIGVVFQNLALFSHMTVLENVLYGLKKGETGRAHEWIEKVRMSEMKERYPSQLSGGQRQRVALARALAPRPDLLLLDEPFSALDGPLRRNLRRELKKLHRETGIPILYVTHHIEDVCALGDSVFFMKQGRISATLPVEDLWNPESQLDAWQLLGWGNLLQGEIASSDGGVWFSWSGGRLLLSPSIAGRGEARAFIAPHHVKILYPRVPIDSQLAPNVMHGKIVETIHLGGVARVLVKINNCQWQIEHPMESCGG